MVCKTGKGNPQGPFPKRGEEKSPRLSMGKGARTKGRMGKCEEKKKKEGQVICRYRREKQNNNGGGGKGKLPPRGDKSTRRGKFSSGPRNLHQPHWISPTGGRTIFTSKEKVVEGGKGIHVD